MESDNALVTWEFSFGPYMVAFAITKGAPTVVHKRFKGILGDNGGLEAPYSGVAGRFLWFSYIIFDERTRPESVRGYMRGEYQ